MAAALASFALALAVIGCNGNPGSTGPVSSPGSSGTTACPSAPSPPDNLAGWSQAAPSDILPLLINPPGQVVCGQNRILFTIAKQDGTPVGAPDRTAKISFYDLGRDPSKPSGVTPKKRALKSHCRCASMLQRAT